MSQQLPSKLSYSMFIDSNLQQKTKQYQNVLKKRRKTIKYVEPKTIYHWMDDKQVTHCHQCGKEFYLFLRRHHCRNCGRIFCYECSSRQIKLPKSTKSEKQRVCDKCFQKINDYNKIKPLIDIFQLLPLTIKDYFTIACVNRDWYHLATRYFSKFREIQYKLNNAEYSQEQKSILINNSHFFTNHSILQLNLLKSINLTLPTKQSEKIENQKLLTVIKPIFANNQKKTCNCWNLMCSRNCKVQFSLEDIVVFLYYRQNFRFFEYYPFIREFIKTKLKLITDEEIVKMLLVLLLFCRHKKTLKNSKKNIIIDNLLTRAKRNKEFAIILFWELNFLKHGKYKMIYRLLQEKLISLFSSTTKDLLLKTQIKKQQNFTEYLRIHFQKTLTTPIITKMNQYFLDKDIYKNSFPVITNPYFHLIKVDMMNVKIKKSSSKPIMIPLLVKNKFTQKKLKYNLLYKKDDLRKEKIIMNIIAVIDLIVKKEEKIDLLLSKYNILPLNHEEGFIEIIPDSITLYDLKLKRFSIQNYINEHNPNRSIHDTKMRFVMSCAGYCVITYVLGIGDRHLENIMLTKNGLLFHIDYGFILGDDPKKLLSPEIRITPEMVDAMGGFDSQYYELFQEICKKTYNCIRRHSNLFEIMLSTLAIITPTIEHNKYNLNMIHHFITKKLVPNENYEEANLKFITSVEKSHKSHYSSRFIDFFHKKKNDVIFSNSTQTPTIQESNNSNDIFDTNETNKSKSSIVKENTESSSSFGSGVYNYFFKT